MKRSRILLVSAATVLSFYAGLCSGSAQELFRALLSTTCVSSNADGTLVYKNTGDRDLIRSCAGEMGLTNFTGLSLMFNRASNSLEVVAGTNQTSVGTNHVIVGTNQFLICTPLTFSNIV